MAKSNIRTDHLLLLAAALYLSSFSKAAEPEFVVEGEVYCDRCRAQFINRLSQPMPGATVRLECRDPQERYVTYLEEGQSDPTGHYSILVRGDHGEEICEVVLVNSSDGDCSEIAKQGWAHATSRITLTANNGIVDNVRRANPLGFLAKKPASECIQVYRELNMLPPEGL